MFIPIRKNVIIFRMSRKSSNNFLCEFVYDDEL